MNGASEVIKQGHREFTADELQHIQTVVANFPRLNRHVLAQTLCEHLDWYSPSGTLKTKSCRVLLERLEDQGVLVLPKVGPAQRSAPDRRPPLTSRTAEQPAMTRSLKSTPVKLEMIVDQAEVALWNEYVERYHPLGHRRPFGNWLRYFLYAGKERVGCLMISSAAKALCDRDRWIGWTSADRQRNLPWVINNSRYLLFPWVRIPHLASHALGQLSRRVAPDWESRWGYRPVLMETFVDPQYDGTCYRAAGWEWLGMTQGRGAARLRNGYQTRPKHIFVKPLDPHFQALLCSNQLQGRIVE